MAGAASTFIMCTRGLTDPDYRKYPPLPVLACRGFDPAPAPAGGSKVAP